MYRLKNDHPEFLLAHPGGPFWAKKDNGSWTIPKGLVEVGEDLLTTAKREFFEETGLEASGEFIQLAALKQKSGKLVHAWAVSGDPDLSLFKSNYFDIAWPPESGLIQSFPEIDKIAWFLADVALLKILPGQTGFITELKLKLKS